MCSIASSERTALMLEKAEQMKGLGMTGADHKDVTTNPLRLRRAAGTLVLERRGESVRDRPRRPASRASLPSLGFGAPLPSVRWHLIA
jgi:hypothetical protein